MKNNNMCFSINLAPSSINRTGITPTDKQKNNNNIPMILPGKEMPDKAWRVIPTHKNKKMMAMEKKTLRIVLNTLI